ncbi:MAG TPA: hypothetical protein VGD88_15475 [Opitutaceae bacterium]
MQVKEPRPACDYSPRLAMRTPATFFAPPGLPALEREAPRPAPAIIAPARLVAGPNALAFRWLGLSVTSLLLAGLLSLSVVVGRLPGISELIGDPLFFKRCLVVHVNLALSVWFYAFVSALATLRAPAGNRRLDLAAYGLAVLGVATMLAGALVRGAEPVLANYIPVIDHPLYIAGLGLFFAAILLFVARRTGPAAGPADGGLPAEAAVGVQVCGIVLVLAAATWISARSALPAGLNRLTFFEFSHWGAGHVLQVANVCAMLAVWLWLLQRATGHSALTPRTAGVLFALLVAPHFAMPLLSAQGVMHRTYIEGATLLMRWGIFPVVLLLFLVGVRHLRRHSLRPDDPAARLARAGFVASAGLTLLGIVLGSLIRGSTSLVPAHYHASLGGVTAAFMTAAHLFFAPGLAAQRQRWIAARRQIIAFGLGQAVFALGFGFAGIHGSGRKTYGSEQHVRTLGEQIGLGVMGLGGLVAAAAGIWFLILIGRALRARRAALVRTSLSPAHP